MRYFIDLIEAASKRTAIPTTSFPKLWHVGTLDATKKRENSHEGSGLSVSLHPESWKKIAPGFVHGDTFICSKSNNAFVDARKCKATHIAMLTEWGIANGWITLSTLWRVSWFDEDDDDRRYFDCQTKAEADIEVAEYEGMDERIEEISGSMVGAQKMWIRARHRPEPIMTLDFLMTFYAEDVLSIDGVWWQDRHDPSNLSAPRGVIVPSKVSSWSFTRNVE